MLKSWLRDLILLVWAGLIQAAAVSCVLTRQLCWSSKAILMSFQVGLLQDALK